MEALQSWQGLASWSPFYDLLLVVVLALAAWVAARAVKERRNRSLLYPDHPEYFVTVDWNAEDQVLQMWCDCGWRRQWTGQQVPDGTLAYRFTQDHLWTMHPKD